MGIESDPFATTKVNMVFVSPAKGKEKAKPSESAPEESTPMVNDSLKP